MDLDIERHLGFIERLFPGVLIDTLGTAAVDPQVVRGVNTPVRIGPDYEKLSLLAHLDLLGFEHVARCLKFRDSLVQALSETQIRFGRG